MNEDEFWKHPLGTWLSSCSTGQCAVVAETSWRHASRRNEDLQYRELCDGVLLALLFNEIEPKSTVSISVGQVDLVRDALTKQKIFAGLLEAIRRFYKHRLNQLIVLSPPDILSIVRNWTPDDSGEELNKFLLLLLGCAVQSDRKKEFIDRITRLGPETQKGIVRHIQKVTEGSSVVLSLQSLALTSSDEIASHLERVMRERDSLQQQVLHMNNDNESDEGSSTTATSSLNGDTVPPRRNTEIRYDRRSPSPTGFDRHSTVQFSSLKAELRKVQNMAEDKDEEINELHDELEAAKNEILRMQEEKLEMMKDQRRAADLQDQLQCAEHKLMRVDKLEAENAKLREREADCSYLKNHIESLRTENEALQDSMSKTEIEMDGLRLRTKNQLEIETRFEESKQAVRKLQGELGEKNSKIEQLLLDQGRLETELMNAHARIEELQCSFDDLGTPRESFGSLADQIEEAERSEAVRLRIEVKNLRSRLEERENSQTPSLVTVDPEPLKLELKQREKELLESRDENDVITKQLHQLEKTLSAINIDFKDATEQLESIRCERDESVKGLHEARRKFAQFQTEFGKKFEREAEIKVREVELELSEVRRQMTSSEEERSETQRQMERVRDEQRHLRETVDNLKEANHQLELQIAQAERAHKNADNERNVMRERSEKLEDELEAQRMRMIAAEDTARRLENSERLMVEQQNKLGDVEAENRALVQQLDLESKKTQRLREDLVSEKTKGAELVGRLRSLCTAVAINGGKIDTDMDDMKLISSIDDVIMGALSAAKREADALRLQQHTQIAELTDLRRDIEKLRRSESASLSESDDRVRELSKENVGIKEQVFLLQEKVRELQIEVASKNSEVAIAKREIEELNRNTTAASVSNTELARLQVSLRNLQLQEELLRQDNSELRTQLELAEKSRQTAKRDADSLAAMHQALLADHDRLQNLHDLLTQDYERTKQDSQDMKSRMRTQRQSPVCVPTRELEELRTLLAQEKASKDKQLRAYADLHNEHGANRRELETLRKDNDVLSRNCDQLSSEVRNLKLADQAQRATIRELNITIEELTRDLHAKELEIAKLNNKIEMLTQLNRTHEEESRNVARQVEMLFRQNKELLDRSLNDKDHYHNEQKDMQERFSALRRHKEKLEEKIMDQYRSMENKRCERSKQPFVKRVGKAFTPKRRPSHPSSNGGSTTEDSSTYSADEAPPLFLGHDEFDLFPPTCSSSDDHDRISPRYDTIPTMRDPVLPDLGQLRSRNDVIGGSVRLPSSNFRRPVVQQNTFEKISFNGPERCADGPSALPSHLPPRAPVRNSSVTASLRSRPPPPPYPKNKPPTYGQRTNPISQSPLMSSSPVMQFAPPLASTPISSPARDADRNVVPEGERRTFIREKDERVDKAMSIYENVQGDSSNKGNESTVWYEYGCV